MKKTTKKNIRKAKFSLRRNAFQVYSDLKYFKPVWQLVNRKAIKSFQSNRPVLSPAQERILNQLNADGIATTSLEELFPNKNILQELTEYLKKRSHREYQNFKKPFLIDLIPEVPELGVEVPFFNLAIDKTILDIVNSYLGLHSVLYYYNIRKTKLSGDALPTHSQNWHRAPQESKNCRVYIYLSDVTEDSGPFMYVPQSTKGGKYAHVAKQTSRTRGYESAEQIEAKVVRSDIMTVTGKAGTVIICDSTGLHRGGYSNKDTRVMSTFGYSAPSFRENINYSYPESLKEKIASTPAVQQVLNPKWER